MSEKRQATERTSKNWKARDYGVSMVVGKDDNRLVGKQDLVHIIILFAIAIGIGIYLIATTTLIAKDGISYINYAKELAINPLKVIRDCSMCAPPSYTSGYPFLILMTHRLVDLFSDGSTVLSWIYSAQAINLLCRILALIPLYFIGKEFVGSKLSFWAIFILVMLPYPARFGSDTLRDWPHMLFLASGFLLLLCGAKSGKWLLFGLAGLVAGFGYAVRPVCAQLIVYGVLWLTLSIFRQKRKCSMSRAKLVGGLALLVVGFSVVALPYIRISGEMPDRFQQTIKLLFSRSSYNELPMQNADIYTAELAPSNVIKAFGKLTNGISESLMYYFLPPLLIGIYCYFQKKPKNVLPFFMTVFLLANIGILTLRYCTSPELSKRYILPLVAVGIFFVPSGLQIMAEWIAASLKRADKVKFCFMVLIIVGIVICIPKLAKPIRIEKKGYRLAAKWLKENVAREDVIVVPDERISFYAERKGIRELGRSAQYIVKKVESQSRESTPPGTTEVWSSYVNNKKKRYKVVIYQRI